MTYKEKVEKEHPTVDSNFVLFTCPGDFLDEGPIQETCPNNYGKHMRCSDCWTQKIPEPETDASELVRIDDKVIAARVKAIYFTLRNEGFNDREAFDIAKIIITEEIRRSWLIEANKNRKGRTDG